jgi:hypothetical protein
VRAEWHFSGGAAYCDGCARQNRPCAHGEPGSEGELCPYIANEPLTDGGWQAWDVLLRCSGQLRLGAGAVVGIELQAALVVGAAFGHDARALAELLPAGEAGMTKALNEQIRTSDLT